MNTSMLPLLAVALLIWAGVWLFVFALDRKVSALEKRVDEVRATVLGPQGGER